MTCWYLKHLFLFRYFGKKKKKTKKRTVSGSVQSVFYFLISFFFSIWLRFYFSNELLLGYYFHFFQVLCFQVFRFVIRMCPPVQTATYSVNLSTKLAEVKDRNTNEWFEMKSK